MKSGTPVDICGAYDNGRWVWRRGFHVMTADAKPKYKKLGWKTYYNGRTGEYERSIVVCGDRGFCFPVCISNVRKSSPVHQDLYEFPRLGGGKVVSGYVVATEEDRKDLEELMGVGEEEF